VPPESRRSVSGKRSSAVWYVATGQLIPALVNESQSGADINRSVRDFSKSSAKHAVFSTTVAPLSVGNKMGLHQLRRKLALPCQRVAAEFVNNVQRRLRQVVVQAL
jgi:hypothetical protein